MPWVTPSSVSTGDVLTASEWNQSVVANSLMGNPVFTNEATRDAAISSPSEGMRAYLTSPTVPAATGGVTAVPTGIMTVYNGTSWVCVTPVGAFTTGNGSTTSTSFTATLSGSPGTNPTVTLTTGTVVEVRLRAGFFNNTAGQTAYMGVAVSGATTLAASSDYAIGLTQATNMFINAGHSMFITGLTAGSNTFTLQYIVSGGTGSFERRGIIVQSLS